GQDHGADGGHSLPAVRRPAVRPDRHRPLGPVADLALGGAHRLVDGVLPAKGHSRDPGAGAMSPGRGAQADGWLRAMPVVFVLIWSTGFIVARYAMPHAPPLKYLAVRYALSAVALCLWARAGAAAGPRPRTQAMHLAITGVLMQAGYLRGVWAADKAGMGPRLAAVR